MKSGGYCLGIFLLISIDVHAQVRFLEKPGEIEILSGQQKVATYVYRDASITRPYFAHLHAPGNIPVSRNHPPVKGNDPDDHATMHPGAWLAFGDIGGADVWRNKARVEFVGFAETPRSDGDRGTFAVKNRYLLKDGQPIAEETCRYQVSIRPDGYLLTSTSEFRAIGRPFTFGDQEEMGFGVRVATPISVKKGGRMVNSRGEVDEKGVWGKAADWCATTGMIAGQPVGVVLMADPKNFRPSWFHARDYGLMVANPFGRKALSNGTESRVEVKPGETFRLGFGLYLGRGEIDGARVFRDYSR